MDFGRAAPALLLAGRVHRSCADVVYFLPVSQMVLPQLPLRFAEHKHVGPVPAVRVSMCSAAALHLTGYAARLFVFAVIPAHGAAGWIAPVVHLRKNPLILCGLGAGLHDAAVEQLRGRFRGRLFLPVLLPWFLRCPNGRIASRCHSVLLQISAPSAAEQRMQFDVSAAYLSGGRFALEYQEL